VAVSADFPVPILVNGYACRNGTDVGRAQKNIDPARPLDGPFGAYKATLDVSNRTKDVVFDRDRIDAVTRDAQQKDLAAQPSPYSTVASPGSLVSLSA
jgi:hypothetical protein